MKKLTGALLLALALLVGGTCAWMPTAKADTVLIIKATQDREATKDLGDGFQARARQQDGGVIFLIHFPSDSYYDSEEHFDRFKLAAHKGLTLLFGCEQFVECAPVVEAGAGASIIVNLKDGRTFEIRPLTEKGDGGPVVGIVLIPVPKA